MPSGEQANEFFGGGRRQSIQAVIPLGTGSVSTQTKAVGVIPRNCRVVGIRMHGQSAPTATSLTGEVKARPTDGGTAVTLQASAADLDFASDAAALAGVEADLTATKANRILEEGQLLEVTVTANTVNPGPGDLSVEVLYEPVG